MKNYLSFSLVILFISMGTGVLAQKTTKNPWAGPVPVVLKTSEKRNSCVKAIIWKNKPGSEAANKTHKSLNSGKNHELGVFHDDSWHTLKKASSFWMTVNTRESGSLKGWKKGEVLSALYLGVKCDVHPAPYKLENVTIRNMKTTGDIKFFEVSSRKILGF